MSLQEASSFFLLSLIHAIVWQKIIDPVQVCSVGSKVSGMLLLPSRDSQPIKAHRHADITGILKCINAYGENIEHSLRIQRKEAEVCMEKVGGDYEIKPKC